MASVPPEVPEMSEEDLKTIFETVISKSPDAIITANMDGVIVFSNPAADRMYGYPTLRGKNLDILVPEHMRMISTLKWRSTVLLVDMSSPEGFLRRFPSDPMGQSFLLR